ncbi:MAG: hypothetical protein CM15mP83_1070 [Flavobacteriaceae bacterium]|nr:MAG: hypothetical protein CM15mP83_1070 [Flavobacteriaceae bacterium]
MGPLPNIFGNRFSIFRNQNHQLISNQFDAILFAFRNPCNLYATEIQMKIYLHKPILIHLVLVLMIILIYDLV